MATQLKKTAKPTLNMYGFILEAFNHFNEKLFDGELPEVLISLQRQKNTFGYFSTNRWRGSEAESVHEIAVNPMYFITEKPLELFQTIVHEMCHLWQHEFGTPSAKTYHNREWADKMESIGLIPSSTGEPGGRRTGQKMCDYPQMPDGRFYLACVELSKRGFNLPYVDTAYPVKASPQIGEVKEAEVSTVKPELVEQVLTTSFSELFSIEEDVGQEAQALADKKKKAVYECPSCQDKAWGKPTLELYCKKCECDFTRK